MVATQKATASGTGKTARKSTVKPMWYKRWGNKLSGIGRGLQFPVTVLPIAAILLRIGSQIPVGDDSHQVSEFAAAVGTLISKAGDFVFGNLPTLFAIGLGFGLTKDHRGEAAVAAFLGMFLITAINSTGGVNLVSRIYHNSSINFETIFGDKGKLDSLVASNVLAGIIIGCLVAYVYNKFNGVLLPPALGFFSGRRLIPVLTILMITVIGVLWAVVFPWIGWCIFKLSDELQKGTGDRWANAGIMFVYGIINRALIPFGMHMIPNTIFWFQLGQMQDASGNIVTGDIHMFISGVAENNHAGTFQSGFFPIFMFGLPALVAAFWFTADNKEQRRLVLTMFGSAALVSFLSGITEPIEYGFLYVAPMLFVAHALITGLFGFITGAFGIQLGFGFSAGLLDYILSIPKSMEIIHASHNTEIQKVFANPGWIFPIGFVAAAVYFFSGVILIKKLNIATPGRGVNRLFEAADESKTASGGAASAGEMSTKAKGIIKALGGYENITHFSNCAVRLRYDVKDSSIVDREGLKRAGAVGSVISSPTHVQVIIGPTVEVLNKEIEDNAPKK